MTYLILSGCSTYVYTIDRDLSFLVRRSAMRRDLSLSSCGRLNSRAVYDAYSREFRYFLHIDKKNHTF